MKRLEAYTFVVVQGLENPCPWQRLKRLWFIGQKRLIIADELDFLITRDRAVLHDRFMLITLPFSRCILLGKPKIITIRAYSKDQIIKILRQRLMRVAAASGDMRKALWVCRSAIEILEAKIKESSISQSSSLEQACFDNQRAAICNGPTKKENSIVRFDHVAAALPKTYKSPVVDTIQSLPQHQQLILCSAVKLFRGRKKDSTVGELNKFFTDVCKSTLVPPVGTVELSSMCRVLADQPAGSHKTRSIPRRQIKESNFANRRG